MQQNIHLFNNLNQHQNSFLSSCYSEGKSSCFPGEKQELLKRIQKQLDLKEKSLKKKLDLETRLDDIRNLIRKTNDEYSEYQEYLEKQIKTMSISKEKLQSALDAYHRHGNQQTKVALAWKQLN